MALTCEGLVSNCIQADHFLNKIILLAVAPAPLFHSLR